ncbi:MAG: OB-fold protein [Candidatus Adiutrix sp.]
MLKRGECILNFVYLKPMAAKIFFLAVFFFPLTSLYAQRYYMEPLVVSPIQLVEDYKRDFHNADPKYTGKLLLLTGRIKTIRPPERSHNIHQDKIYAYITMDTGRNRPLAIYFWEWEAEKMNRLRSGSTITVMGFCQGVTPQLSIIAACVYPDGCGGPVQGFEGPHFKLPPSPPPPLRRQRP